MRWSLGALVAVVVLASPIAYLSIRWKASHWLPRYCVSSIAEVFERDAPPRHLMFVMVDHYEPGFGDEGAAFNREWIDAFRAVSSAHRDSHGNPYRHSWFYAYDHGNEAVLADLSLAVEEGLGEIDLHWHHPRELDNAGFERALDEAVRWFAKHGALVAADGTPHFGYIHGNWALDGCAPFCHVTNELKILQDAGCYADFTFSTVGTSCQPSMVNTLYQATESDASLSHRTGEPLRVGSPVDGFVIFGGPIGLLLPRLEYGAVEFYAKPTPRRVRFWVDSHISVDGRPEWAFVKVYTHSAQSFDALFRDGDLADVLTWLQDETKRRGIELHYVTAREAYNIARAAVSGETGNPEAYRDFVIPPPANRTGLRCEPSAGSMNCQALSRAP